MKKMTILPLLCGLICPLINYGRDHTQELIDYLQTSAHAKEEVSAVLKKIDTFIQSGADADGRDRTFNSSPLQHAVQLRYPREVIELLVAKGARVNVRTGYGNSALSHAIGNNDKDIVELLVNLGARVLARDLFYSVGDDLDESLWRFLFSRCQDLNERIEKNSNLLHRAAHWNHKVARLLLDYKVDIHARHLKEVSSVLHTVCKSMERFTHMEDQNYESIAGDFKMLITELVKRGISANVEDAHGTTPLHIVVKSSSLQLQPILIELLISLGADPMKKDHDGLSPLHYVSHSELPSSITQDLLAAIKKYKPEILEQAQAELKEDIESVKESTRTRSWHRTILGEYVFPAAKNLLAVVGAYFFVKTYMWKAKRS